MISAHVLCVVFLLVWNTGYWLTTLLNNYFGMIISMLDLFECSGIPPLYGESNGALGLCSGIFFLLGSTLADMFLVTHLLVPAATVSFLSHANIWGGE